MSFLDSCWHSKAVGEVWRWTWCMTSNTKHTSAAFSCCITVWRLALEASGRWTECWCAFASLAHFTVWFRLKQSIVDHFKCLASSWLTVKCLKDLKDQARQWSVFIQHYACESSFSLFICPIDLNCYSNSIKNPSVSHTVEANSYFPCPLWYPWLKFRHHLIC